MRVQCVSERRAVRPATLQDGAAAWRTCTFVMQLNCRISRKPMKSRQKASLARFLQSSTTRSGEKHAGLGRALNHQLTGKD